MNKLLLLFILCLSTSAFAQQACLCSQNFDFAYQKLKNNYAGWEDKVRPDNKATFDKLSTEIKEKAKSISNDRECYFLLKKWIDFFQDGHVFITPISPYPIDESPEVIAKPLVPVKFLHYLLTKQVLRSTWKKTKDVWFL